MSYLKELRHLYKQKIEALRDDFDDHFTNIINEKLKQVIPKIKEQIEDNIVEYISNYDLTGEHQIDFESVNINQIYNDKFSSLFDEYLKEKDCDDATQHIENFIENLEVFKNIKKTLEVRFDGLKFSVFAHVQLQKKSGYYINWGINRIEITIFAYLSDW
jgi:hypothetical protein